MKLSYAKSLGNELPIVREVFVEITIRSPLAPIEQSWLSSELGYGICKKIRDKFSARQKPATTQNKGAEVELKLPVQFLKLSSCVRQMRLNSNCVYIYYVYDS